MKPLIWFGFLPVAERETGAGFFKQLIEHLGKGHLFQNIEPGRFKFIRCLLNRCSENLTWKKKI